MRSFCLSLVILAACGGDNSKTPDASVSHDAPADTAIDGRPDATPDAPPDAPPDAAVTDGIADALAAADGTGLTLPIHHVTVTYVKPQIGSTTNDPAGFTVQTQAAGPALFVAVDPATLTPAPAKGDVVDFTITEMATVAMERRAQAIDTLAVVSSGTDVSTLSTDVTSATDLVSNLTAYDSRIVTVTGSFADAAASSGQGFQKFTLTTTGITGEPNLQLRVPATLVDSLDMVATCSITATNVPVGRFNTAAEIGVYTASDFTLTACPAPAVVSATALSATSIRITFSRNIDPTSVVDASQFTVAGLTVSNPVVSGRTVTLDTTAQTSGTDYDAVVANTVKDLQGSALATTLDAHFNGFTVLAGVRINELNAEVTTPATCDLIELRVTSDGTMAGYTIKERNGGSTELNFTFPVGFNVHKNDFIVVHENSGNVLCNPGTATAETGAVNDQPAALYAGNYDSAYDFWATDTGLTDTDNVITVFDSTGMIVDALLVSDDPAALTAASATETAAATVLAANQWQPPTSQVGAYIDTVFRMNAVDDLDATGTTTAGTSIQRLNDMDTDGKADWTTGAGAASTFGALNAGQAALP